MSSVVSICMMHDKPVTVSIFSCTENSGSISAAIASEVSCWTCCCPVTDVFAVSVEVAALFTSHEVSVVTCAGVKGPIVFAVTNGCKPTSCEVATSFVVIVSYALTDWRLGTCCLLLTETFVAC